MIQTRPPIDHGASCMAGLLVPSTTAYSGGNYAIMIDDEERATTTREMTNGGNIYLFS